MTFKIWISGRALKLEHNFDHWSKMDFNSFFHTYLLPKLCREPTKIGHNFMINKEINIRSIFDQLSKLYVHILVLMPNLIFKSWMLWILYSFDIQRTVCSIMFKGIWHSSLLAIWRVPVLRNCDTFVVSPSF